MTTLGLSPSYDIFILSSESSLPENCLQNISIIAFFIWLQLQIVLSNCVVQNHFQGDSNI